MTLEEVQFLYRQLYWDDEEVRQFIPEQIVKWAEEVIIDNFKKAESEGSRKKIVIKVNHIKKVIEAGMEIIKESPVYGWNTIQGITVCFLHDIGRFPQSLKNTFSDEISDMDHGKIGAQMFKNKDFRIKSLNNKEIAEAIEWHNKRVYPGDNIYAKLARDADKIGLFREFERLDADSDERGYVGNEINEDVLNEFRDKVCVSAKNQKSKADWLVGLASWYWDLNFEASKRIFAKENLLEPIEKKISKDILNSIRDNSREFCR